MLKATERLEFRENLIVGMKHHGWHVASQSNPEQYRAEKMVGSVRIKIVPVRGDGNHTLDVPGSASVEFQSFVEAAECGLSIEKEFDRKSPDRKTNPSGEQRNL